MRDRFAYMGSMLAPDAALSTVISAGPNYAFWPGRRSGVSGLPPSWPATQPEPYLFAMTPDECAEALWRVRAIKVQIDATFTLSDPLHFDITLRSIYSTAGQVLNGLATKVGGSWSSIGDSPIFYSAFMRFGEPDELPLTSPPFYYDAGVFYPSFFFAADIVAIPNPPGVSCTVSTGDLDSAGSVVLPFPGTFAGKTIILNVRTPNVDPTLTFSFQASYVEWYEYRDKFGNNPKWDAATGALNSPLLLSEADS